MFPTKCLVCVYLNPPYGGKKVNQVTCSVVHNGVEVVNIPNYLQTGGCQGKRFSYYINAVVSPAAAATLSPIVRSVRLPIRIGSMATYEELRRRMLEEVLCK